jgi:primosomal protein N' (replication factor Y)
VDGDPVDVALAAAELGQSIVVAPSATTVTRVGTGLRRAGAFAARWPRDFAAAAAGATVVGGRGAVFAPAPVLRSIVVIDEHDERLQNEASPTWNARELAIERARRAGVPCLLVSPVPSLEARRAAASGPAVDRAAFRSGWPTVRVVDRREEDRGRSGLFAPALVEQIRLTLDAGERVVCVLNRTGRARLLACRTCGGLLDCELCGATVRQDDAGELWLDRHGEPPPGSQHRS